MKNKIDKILIILVTAILCILRGLGVISIPWIWCFGPLWIPIALLLCIILVVLIVYIILYITEFFRK